VQLQVLDPGRLDPEVNRELRDGAVIAEGIERDRHGRPVAYHLRKRTNDLAPVGVIQTRDVERVEAADVIHWFRRDEPEQTRGIPWAAPVASLIRHLDKYREAAVVAARTGAASMGFLESEDGDEADGELPVEIDPGSMIQLPPGFRFSAFDPGYPDGEFGEFVRATLRGIAAGLGVSYATLAGDLSDVNYSSIRQGALDERDTWRTHQDRLIAEVVQPVFDAWLEAALLAGAIASRGTPFKLGSRALLEPVTWTPRRWQWVDPVKETAANVSAIQAGLKSPSEVVREQGRDLTEVAEEIKRDLAILREAGVDLFGGER
jgi:lambda family phage portal protein